MRSLPILIVLVLAAACGGSSKKAAAEPTADPAAVEPVTEPTAQGDPCADPDADELSKEDCEAVLDHVHKLLVEGDQQQIADDMAANRDESLTECMATGTRKDYECFIAAKVLSDIQNCGT